jgi:hypothetical protein
MALTAGLFLYRLSLEQPRPNWLTGTELTVSGPPQELAGVTDR